MSASAALDFTYRYAYPSSVGDFEEGFGLRLATCGARQECEHFFSGRLRQPRCIADMLLVLSNVVRTHFFLARIPMLDPVVTSSEDMLRFEGFSGCCGVYVRADLPPDAFESDFQGRGTTNVDFNNPMRAALTRLRDREDVRLAVGQDEVALSRSDDKVVEKKVKLPIRWIKGFSEVQAYMPGLELRYEISASEARRFVRSLTHGGAPKQPRFVMQSGKSLRLSIREKPGAIRLTGVDRVRSLEPLLGAAKGLRIWADAESGVSGWEVVFDVGRFFLLVSPELYRGFSGEGQVLERLATGNWQDALADVQAQLAWQSMINTEEISKQAGVSQEDIRSALAVLGSRGLAGFDVSAGAYFHRVLPFELDKVEELQPRLKGANKLLEDGRVRIAEQISEDECDLLVGGTGVEHSVRLRSDQDKCTCPWFSKYRGQRGPCKHILAARMFIEKGGIEQ